MWTVRAPCNVLFSIPLVRPVDILISSNIAKNCRRPDVITDPVRKVGVIPETSVFEVFLCGVEPVWNPVCVTLTKVHLQRGESVEDAVNDEFEQIASCDRPNGSCAERVISTVRVVRTLDLLEGCRCSPQCRGREGITKGDMRSQTHVLVEEPRRKTGRHRGSISLLHLARCRGLSPAVPVPCSASFQ